MTEMGVWERALEGCQYFVGDSLSIVDITLFPSLYHAAMCGFPFARFPNLDRWYKNLDSRPSFKDNTGVELIKQYVGEPPKVLASL